MIQDAKRFKPPRALESMQILMLSPRNEAVQGRQSGCGAGTRWVWVQGLALPQHPRTRSRPPHPASHPLLPPQACCTHCKAAPRRLASPAAQGTGTRPHTRQEEVFFFSFPKQLMSMRRGRCSWRDALRFVYRTLLEDYLC